MKTNLKQYDNSWYNPGGTALKRVVWYFANLLIIRNPFLPLSPLKVLVLRAFGARIGIGVVIKPLVSIKYPWNLTIGDHTWIGESVWIDNLAHTTIGSNCCLSQGALLLCGNHNYKKTTFDLQIGEITLDDGVWIGAQATVCPGVHCATHAVLGVNSVANRNLEAYTIYVGNPAQAQRKRNIEV